MQVIDKLLEIKKRAVKYSIIYSIMLIVISLIEFFLSNTAQKQEYDRNYILSSINSANNEIANINKKIQDTSKAKGLWEEINSHYGKRDGLEIDKAKDILDSLKKIYHLTSEITINLSSPSELTNLYKTETTTIVSSTVEISFSALTDQIAYQFIDSIRKNFPGFVIFKHFSITSQGTPVSEIIKNINSGKFSPVVNVSLTFDWQDFKDIDKKAEKK